MGRTQYENLKTRLETISCVFSKLFPLKTLYRVIFLFAIVSPAHAIDLPDAGSILHEINPQRLPILPEESATIAPELSSKEYPNDMTIIVDKYEFSGNTLVDEQELLNIAADFIDRPVGLNDLHLLTDLIAQYYRDQGFFARVFLPRQAIDDGVIKIKILESTYSGIVLETATDILRTDDKLIEKIFSARQGLLEPTSLPHLERALLLAQDWPGLNVSASLKAGEKSGETAMLVIVENSPLVDGKVTLDNFGSKNTGAERFTGIVSVNAPYGLGERFNFEWLKSEGTKYIRAEASMPIFYDGLRASIDASYLDYRVVNRLFSNLGLEGYSDSFGASLSYPLIRSNTKNLFLTSRLEHKDYANGSKITATDKYSINNFSVGFHGNYYDALGHGGVNSFWLNLQAGDVLKNKSEPSEGGFNIWKYWLQRDQNLSAQFSARFSISGQRASRALDSAEQFSIGGASNLQAYPVNEGRGSDGDLLKLQLIWYPSLPCNCSLSSTLNYGRVKALADNSDTNSHYYKSLGVQANWYGLKGWSVTASIAKRIGDNPLPTLLGTDQDGSLKETRLWFSVSKYF